jgi:uncharacterized protein YndB with AHSA1/START domain
MDDLDPILIQVTVPLPIPMIYAALTDAAQLTQWLASSAKVEPRVGGPYELTFDSEPKFTSRGQVTHLTADADIGFTWRGPPAFDEILAEPAEPTTVYLRLAESPEGIDVTLEHAGWKSGEAWEDARSWHFHFWDDKLHILKDHLLKVAYG